MTAKDEMNPLLSLRVPEYPGNRSKEIVHAFDCGCTADQATGIPISTCRRHDQRTREVKASAALMQMANALDEAGRAPVEGPRDSSLREAARYAVKAAKALIGADTE